MAVDTVSGAGYPAAQSGLAVHSYLHAVRRRWPVVILITLLTVGIAAFTLSRTTQTYQTSASILVSPVSQSSSAFQGISTVIDTGDPARTVETAAALVDTPEAAAGAAAQLGHRWTAGAVASDVSVTPRGASNVLAVTAQASSGDDAAKVANAFASAAIAYRARVVQRQIASELSALEARLTTVTGAPNSEQAAALSSTIASLQAVQGSGKEPTLSVSQTAQAPSSPTGAPRSIILALALIGGFALGSVAAVALEAFTRPIRDREEAVSLFPIPVLATVPRVSGHRRGNMRPWDFSPVAFEQMRMLRVQLSLGVANPVIMITSAGAGDGKTTIAAALAAAFAEADDDVILMDLDLRKPDLAQLLGVERGSGDSEVSDELPDGVPIPVPQLPGVKLVPAPRGDIARFEMVIRRLPDLVAHARRCASCVIIDTAPVGEVSEALRIAPICDQVVFVARPRHTDRRRLSLSRELLNRAGARMAGLVLVDRDSPLQAGYYSYGYATGPNGVTEKGRKSREPRDADVISESRSSRLSE
jgi:Mrp family chromosome partitioning ATPase